MYYPSTTNCIFNDMIKVYLSYPVSVIYLIIIVDDHSRVKLGPNNEYINANYIKVSKVNEIVFSFSPNKISCVLNNRFLDVLL